MRILPCDGTMQMRINTALLVTTLDTEFSVMLVRPNPIHYMGYNWLAFKQTSRHGIGKLLFYTVSKDIQDWCNELHDP